jgi:hypothetical protein
MPALDSHTIIVVSVALYYLVAVLTTFFSLSLRAYPGIAHWSLATWGWALFSALFLIRGVVTPWISVVLANLGLIVAVALLSMGLSLFAGTPPRRRQYLLICLATLAGFIYFTFIQPSFAGRVTCFSLAHCVILADMLRVLRRYRLGTHDASRVLAMICCLISMLFFALRGAVVWLYPAQSLDQGHPLVTTWSLLFFPLGLVALVFGLVSLAAARFAHEAEQSQAELAQANRQLQEALDNVRTLRGLLPICSGCKKIRDDQGQWQVMEGYIQRHSEASFTHGLCPECMRQIYPNLVRED